MRRAFATLLTDDSFLPGVHALLRSLQTTSPPSCVTERVVMVTGAVSRLTRAKLKRLGAVVLEVCGMVFIFLAQALPLSLPRMLLLLSVRSPN